MNNIVVFCELNEEKKDLSLCSYELITKAYELSKQANSLNGVNYTMEAVCCDNFEYGTDIFDKEKVFSSGADKFTLIENKNIKKHNFDVVKDTFLNYFKNNYSDVILFPATIPMRQCAPSITVNLNCGLVADCTDLNFILKDEKLLLSATRPTFGSELMATIISKKMPQCATVRPKIFENKKIKEATGEFILIKDESENNKEIKLLSSVLLNNSNNDIENAKIVLCAGFGIYTADKSYYKKLEKIAQITNAQIACTRKVVDFGIMEQKFQVGLTGVNISPNLYVAFGVSGAIQHVCSIKNSKKIIAINQDVNAEIFNYADFKIIKDAKSVIDEILSLIEK